MKKNVYYLPGHGGNISTGLGEGLLARGCVVTGRETTGEFQQRSFREQVDVIAGDLASKYWREDVYVVAVSFGAYLFLHAQAQLLPYIGKVLLLSPIVGAFSSDTAGLSCVPPRADYLRELVEQGKLASPMNCQIHVGEQDWQSQPDEVVAFAKKLSIPVTVVPGAGHMLGKDYVGPVLDSWLDLAK